MFPSKKLYVTLNISFLVICLLLLSPVDARWTRRPRRTTTPRSTTSRTTVNPDRHQHLHHWPPLVAPPAQPQTQPQVVVVQKPSHVDTSPRLIDSYDQRSLDGQYEFRYQLDNGNTRYERAYWLPVGKELVLAKKGYYSVPLPNDKYSTVFYTADHRGYHVDMQTLSVEQPLLPRSLEVPVMEREMGTEMGTGTGTKRNSISDPERNELDVVVDEDENEDVDVDVDASGAGTELVPNAVNQVETETEPSTLANDILATEAPADSHVVDDHHDDNDDDDEDDDDDDGEGASN
ncbi:endocuticle structural glycoprotein SgAbd-1 [Drosophila eugracilis]|uniref:endocuticle structural glycoprotein SgAbd-1 n=1 Tax=Drosophila eugracilis TaxID=29029 RepID=UPI0007E662B0|nr:endocuticle structural glycoprotein SgAbd-1 [Drosophila eugracilis]